ncbi:MAG: dipeptide ABC transporter ATP-binding protein [Streptosporangiales bacterium]|nr:dipeptide ABC transporter ATP-binding protein [Streptosporangiales bacterium]
MSEAAERVEETATTGVQVRGLRVETTQGTAIVEELDLDIAPGKILGLVGESGSGKTTVGLAMLGHARRGMKIAAGSIVLDGTDLLALSLRELRDVRGVRVSYVPQDPGAALNPAMRIGKQISEALAVHGWDGVDERVREVLEEVDLPTDDEFVRRWPHELSGGQQQRIGIAMAFACRPALVVLDEPTTGLDVTTQGRVLDTVHELAERHGCAALYISHDLAVVADVADDVAVMYAGSMVEKATTEDIVRDPGHPYTARLVAAVPDLEGKRELRGIPGTAPTPAGRPSGCRFAPRCTLATAECEAALPEIEEFENGHLVRCVHTEQVTAAFTQRAQGSSAAKYSKVMLHVVGLAAKYGDNPVLHDLDLTVTAGSCMALLGESGSGKTTLAQTVAGLHADASGEILLHGEQLPFGVANRTRESLRSVAYVFQNPYASLNPRRTIGSSIARPLRVLAGTSNADAMTAARDTLERVGLSASLAERYPDQLSGGERQRAAIARALVTEPELLICDEVTSALDVSVQATVVELLADLRAEMGLTLLFVTHDIALVRNIAQEVAVLQEGRIVEHAPVEQLFATPAHAYTQELLDTTPALVVR